MTKTWRVADYDLNEIQDMAKALGMSPLTVAVLFGRGVAEVKHALQWLSRLDTVEHNPFLMPDMRGAVDRLHYAVQHGERICCYGDYDVDGMSATSLYLLFLREHGANVGFYIPDRQTEGYGLNEPAIHQLAKEGVKVLITVDCGTTSYREIDVANRLGMDVIITDHHQMQGDVPPALAFLNPYRSDCRYPFKGLCSAGVAYKVVQAYSSLFDEHTTEVPSFTDLVALATLADLVPLVDENRWMVRQGLDRMSHGPRCGIRALQQTVGEQSKCTESLVAFQLAPMLNAAGRLAHARFGVDLLTTLSGNEANQLAGRLRDLNRHRREIEREMFQEAVESIEKKNLQGAVVVGCREWHVGVVGIVASRLVERYQEPAVVIAFDKQGLGRGSVRSVPGLDVCRVLEQCSDLLEGFGGHPAAAGLQIWEERLPEFHDRFSSVVADQRDQDHVDSILDIDAQVSLSQVNHQLLGELGQLHPFGVGNPEPTFMATGLRVLEHRVVGDDHLKLIVRQNHSVPFESIGFRMGSRKDVRRLQERPIDLAFVPELNRWRGLDRVQLRIRDMKVTEGMHCL